MDADELFELKRTYRLPDGLARLLWTLAHKSHVTSEEIQRLSLSADPKVAIHRLRRKLKPFEVTIESQRNTGYWLDDASKNKVRSLIGQATTTASSVELAA